MKNRRVYGRKITTVVMAAIFLSMSLAGCKGKESTPAATDSPEKKTIIKWTDKAHEAADSTNDEQENVNNQINELNEQDN